MAFLSYFSSPFQGAIEATNSACLSFSSRLLSLDPSSPFHQIPVRMLRETLDRIEFREEGATAASITRKSSYHSRLRVSINY
jgi:hypothetical protein